MTADKRLNFISSLINNEEKDQIKQNTFSVAPMMDYTDKHQRKLQRMITNDAVLYTEMIVANTLIHTKTLDRYAPGDFELDKSLVLQLGGSSSIILGQASKIAHSLGYQNININCGCPSERVAGSGNFGASLMLSPDLVAEMAMAVGNEIGKPASIKCRIGVDDNDSYDQLAQFINKVNSKGYVTHFIIHARKAILSKKMSPAQNRSIPPLNYKYVYDLVQDFPHLYFTLNGGIQTYQECENHLSHGVTGVMVGRKVIEQPFYWRNIDSKLYNQKDAGLSRREIINSYAAYAQGVEDQYGRKLRRALIKPLLHLFNTETNAKRFRSQIDINARESATVRSAILDATQQCIGDSDLDLR